MDKYQEAAKQAAAQALSQANINLSDLAAERLQYFAAVITRLLTTEQEKFDLVISGGDSGLITTKIVAHVYTTLGLVLPPVAVLPIQRYTASDLKTYFKHTNLASHIPSVPNLQQVLFVDDEIRIGWTAHTCLTTLASTHPTRFNCVIVADNHFFEWHFKDPDINLRYYSPGHVIPGINQVFTHLISDADFQFIQSLTDKIQDRQQAVAILVSGKFKMFTGEEVFFDADLEPQVLIKNPRYQQLKADVENKISELVKSGVSRFQSGSITFKF